MTGLRRPPAIQRSLQFDQQSLSWMCLAVQRKLLKRAHRVAASVPDPQPKHFLQEAEPATRISLALMFYWRYSSPTTDNQGTWEQNPQNPFLKYERPCMGLQALPLSLF